MASTVCNNQISAAPLEALPESAQTVPAEKGSYGQILKSSAVVGGAQVMNIAIGIVRTKAMAIFLGPAGFGLAGLYNSIADLTQNIAGMGVNSSGVRQIAEAVGSDDVERMRVTVAVLRRTSVVLGLLGSLLLLVFSRRVSILTFGTDQHAGGVAVLSIAVFCKLVSGGQGALIQGMRRIGDLAKMNVVSAVLGALIGVSLVYFFRENGIVPYLVAIAGMSVVTSWWYSRKVEIRTVRITLPQFGQEAAALLKLGVAFMVSSMMTLSVAYAIRVILLRKNGLQATGLYQSAWTFGGLYVGFILQAMAADFYPRLTASIKNHEISNRLVNEQARVGLLLAGPGVIATLTFAPVIIALLYSAKFGASVPILRWVCLGALLQVISWPMGFIIVAKGKQNLFIFSEVAWAVMGLGLAWGCITYFGVVGAGIAFFGSYLFHGFLTYAIVSRLSGFRWSKENMRMGLLFLSAIAVVFCGLYLLPFRVAISIGVLATVSTSVCSLRALVKLVATDDIPRPLRRLLMAFRVAAPESTTVN